MSTRVILDRRLALAVVDRLVRVNQALGRVERERRASERAAPVIDEYEVNPPNLPERFPHLYEGQVGPAEPEPEAPRRRWWKR